ncbi:MAG: GNAT family N-acetyltransferase [Sulfitobacter sp.]
MILLRTARSTDAGRVGEILSEFVDTTPWMPRVHTRAQDIAHAGALIEKGWVIVAEKEGVVCGFAACDAHNLNALYVGSAWRGQGVGSTLLIHLQRSKPRLRLWTFEANERAQTFYRRHGFEEITRTQGAANDENLPDIRFEWQREAA